MGSFANDKEQVPGGCRSSFLLGVLRAAVTARDLAWATCRPSLLCVRAIDCESQSDRPNIDMSMLLTMRS